MKKTSLFLFHKDLRLEDNFAFQKACQHDNVLPLYIFDEKADSPWKIGGASKWCLHHSLANLDESLKERKSKLFLFKGTHLDILSSLCEKFHVEAVYWNEDYGPFADKKERKIEKFLKEKNIIFKKFSDTLIQKPGNVLKKDGKPYLVFTAFWNAFLKTPFLFERIQSFNIPKSPVKKIEGESLLEDLELLPQIPWDKGFYEHWEMSEKNVQKKLQNFLKSGIQSYNEERNFPSIEGTSTLSPYLHFGQIHPSRIWFEIEKTYGSISKLRDVNLIQFAKEIVWREFSYHLLHFFPHLPNKPMNSAFEKFPWKDDKVARRAWEKGQTGFPIVDAGMRELWHTGWMHNRVRMIVASFLTKDLHIPWQKGAQWFWDTLVDADLANNTQGWQWTAGCGVDAAPFFRIFNPVSQGENYDPEGDYVKTWCPELEKLPKKWIHKPWEAPTDILKKAGVSLGKNYPEPIVDHKKERQKALFYFERLKKNKS